MTVTYPVNTRKTLKINTGPFKVKPGEDNVFRMTLKIGRRGWLLQDIWVFMGRDLGDEAEMDVEVYDGTRPLYLRSDHGLLRYQAWTHQQVWWDISKGVTVALFARANGRNKNLKRDWIRPHFGVYLTWDEGVIP